MATAMHRCGRRLVSTMSVCESWCMARSSVAAAGLSGPSCSLNTSDASCGHLGAAEAPAQLKHGRCSGSLDA